jgi:hypothetical protein
MNETNGSVEPGELTPPHHLNPLPLEGLSEQLEECKTFEFSSGNN